MAASVAGCWIFGAARLPHFGIFAIGVLVAGAMCAIRPLVFREEARLRWPMPALVAVAFIAYAAIRIPGAACLFDAKVEVFKVVTYLTAFLVLLELAGTRQRWKWLLVWLFVSVSLMAWYAIIQESHGSFMVLNRPRPETYGMRASGAFICPNHFASLLELVVAMGLAMVFCPDAGFGLRLLGGYAFVLSFVPLYLSQSRSGWLGAITAVLVTSTLLAARKGARRMILTIVTLVILVSSACATLWFSSDMVRTRVGAALRGDIRISLWKDTVSMIGDRPMAGFGPASYKWVYPSYQQHMKAYLNPNFAHNDYLNALVDYGAAGLALLALVVASAGAHWLRHLRGVENSREACLISGACGALAASLVHATFDFNFQVFSIVHALVLLGGTATAALYACGRLPDFRVAGKGRTIAAAAGLSLCLATSAVMGLAYASDAFTRTGNGCLERMQVGPARDAYRTAMVLDRGNWEPVFGLAHLLRGSAQWNLHKETRAEQIAEAMDLYERAAKLNAWEPAMLHGMAKLEDLRGNKERAADLLFEVVRRQPVQPYYLTELGLQLRSMRRWQEALDVFRRAGEIEPSELIDLNIRLLEPKAAAASG